MLAAPLLLLALSWQAASYPPVQVRMSWQVQQKTLLQYVQPEYSDLARLAHIEGTVRFTMIVGTDGRVRSLKLLSGHPLLVPSAFDAAKRWVFRVPQVDGEPAEVITVVALRFTIGREVRSLDPDLPRA